MAREDDVILLRVIASELYLLVGLQMAREMFGKAYQSLGIGEKTAVDHAVNSMLAGNLQMMNPDTLKQLIGKPPQDFQSFEGKPPQ